MLEKMYRRNEVEQITGLCRAAIYEKMRKGTFPRQVKLGPKAVAWRESDLRAWLETRPQVQS